MQARRDIRRIATAAIPWSIGLHVVAALALMGLLVVATGDGTGVGGLLLRYLIAGIGAAVLSMPGLALGAVASRANVRRAPIWIGFGAVVPLGTVFLVLGALGATTPGVLAGALALLMTVGGLLTLILQQRQQPAVLS